MNNPLPVDVLRIDADTQNRLKINEEVVEDYTQLIVDNDGEWPFAAVDVFHDGNEYLVADGFHRTLAAHRAKLPKIPCNIHKGTATDARIFGMKANDRHGLRMSRADKRGCVEWLLDNGGKMTQTEVAAKAGVSRRLVQIIVAERNPASMAGKAQVAPDPPNRGVSDEDGARVEVLAKCTTAVQKGVETGVFKPSDADLKLLAKLTAEDQNVIAMDLRKEKASSVKESMKAQGIKQPGKKKPKPKLAKKLDKKACYKQWDQAIGPLLRVLDKIARDVGEWDCASHTVIHGQLQACTDEMAEWLGVKP